MATALALTPGTSKKMVLGKFVWAVQDLQRKYGHCQEAMRILDRVCNLYYDRFNQGLSPERREEIDQSILEDLDLIQLHTYGLIPQTSGKAVQLEA